MQMSANGWQPWNANGRDGRMSVAVVVVVCPNDVSESLRKPRVFAYWRYCSNNAAVRLLLLLLPLLLRSAHAPPPTVPLSKVCNILPSSSAVTMADPLYSRSQMSTVAVAAIAAVRDCGEGEGRETIPKGTLVARCPTNLGSARRRRGERGREGEGRHTRRHESLRRRQNGGGGRERAS